LGGGATELQVVTYLRGDIFGAPDGKTGVEDVDGGSVGKVEEEGTKIGP